MAKELLLYYGLYSFTCEEIIKAIEDHADEEVIIRVNCPGGDVFASWGLFAKITEHGDVTIKVDGLAGSGAANLLLYAKRVECLDISTFMFHRADAYIDTPEQQKMLNDINADLRKKIEARVTAEKFKEVTGHTFDEMFNPETRINIWLTAKQMKKLGIVQKITTLKPAEQREMAAAMAQWEFKVAASADPTPIQTKENMTLEELRTKFPALYSQIFADGEKSGIKKESDRVSAWMTYAAIDAKKVAEGIKSGADLTQKDMAEFNVAALSDDRLKKLATDSSKDVTTDAGATTPEAKTKEIKAFEDQINSLVGLKKKPDAATV